MGHCCAFINVWKLRRTGPGWCVWCLTVQVEPVEPDIRHEIFDGGRSNTSIQFDDLKVPKRRKNSMMIWLKCGIIDLSNIDVYYIFVANIGIAHNMNVWSYRRNISWCLEHSAIVSMGGPGYGPSLRHRCHFQVQTDANDLNTTRNSLVMVPIGFYADWTFLESPCFSDPPVWAVRRHERKDLEAKVWEARNDLKLREKVFNMNQVIQLRSLSQRWIIIFEKD